MTRYLPGRAPLAVVVLLALSACTSGAGHGGTAPPTYRAAGVSVRAVFPRPPSRVVNPAGLTANFPAGTAVTAWVAGRLGSMPVDNSFELAVVSLPASVSTAAAERLLAEFASGAARARFAGHLAFRSLERVGTAIAGLLASTVAPRRLLVVGAYGDRAKVTAFLGSVRLVAVT